MSRISFFSFSANVFEMRRNPEPDLEEEETSSRTRLAWWLRRRGRSREADTVAQSWGTAGVLDGLNYSFPSLVFVSGTGGDWLLQQPPPASH